MKLSRIFVSIMMLAILAACSTDLRKVTVSDYMAADPADVQKTFSDDEQQLMTNAFKRFESENISASEYGVRIVQDVLDEQRDWEQKETERLAEQERQRKIKLAEGTKKMKQALTFKVINKGYQKATVGDYIVLHIALNNNTDKKIRSFYGMINISDKSGAPLHEFRYTSVESVAPNARFEEKALMECKPNDPNIIKIREADFSDLNIEAKSVEVKYFDNSKLSIKEFLK